MRQDFLRIVVFVMIVLLILPASTGAQDDPTPLQIGETLIVDYPYDTEIYFTFTPQVGDLIGIIARPQTVPGGLAMQYRPPGERWVPTISTTYRGEPLVAVIDVASAGDYLFKLYVPNNEPGTVALTLARLQREGSGGGRYVQPGDRLGGDLGAAAQSWWLEGRAGEAVGLRAMMAECEASLTLVGPTGAEVAPDVGDDIGRGSTVPRLHAVLPLDGTYRLDLAASIEGVGEQCRFVLDVLELDPTVLSYGSTYNGTLESGNHLDTVLIDGNVGDLIAVDVRAANPDDLHIEYAISGAAVPRYASGALSHRWLLMQDEPLPLTIYSERESEAGGPFTVSVTQARAAQPVQPVSLDSSFEHTLAGDMPTLYSFEGRAGEAIHIAVDSGTFLAQAALAGPGGLFVQDQRSGPYGGALFPNIILPADGTYYFMPHEPHGNTYSGSTTLPVEMRRLDLVPIEPYDEPIEGTLRGDAVDIYYFDVQAGEHISAILTSEQLTASDLYLFGPNGRMARGIEISYEAAVSDRLAALPAVRVPVHGVYAVVVDTFQGGSSGDYTLTVSAGINSRATALEPGQQVQQPLMGDAHVFQVQTAPGDRLQISRSGAYSEETYGPDGQRVPVGPDDMMLAATGGIYTLAMAAVHPDDNLTATVSVTVSPDPDRVDSDGDGLYDGSDRCPAQAGPLEGCPDSDGDGFVDPGDLCPDEPGPIQGCADSDGDGLADPADACPDEAGSADGCPDSDGDGVADSADECPELPGVPELNGCGFLGSVANRVNLRAGAGTNFEIVGQVEAGDEFFVLGRNAAGDWLRMRTLDNSLEAWIFADLVTTEADIMSLPVVE